jgi:hypothetical protein
MRHHDRRYQETETDEVKTNDLCKLDSGSACALFNHGSSTYFISKGLHGPGFKETQRNGSNCGPNLPAFKKLILTSLQLKKRPSIFSILAQEG